MSFRDQILQTAHAYIAAHNGQDFDRISALCDPACVHRTGPKSLKNPDRNNENYIAFNISAFKRMHTMQTETKDVLADEASRKVVLYLDARGTGDAGVYEDEYIITLTMTEDGKKVLAQYDFYDSHAMLSWIAKVGKAAQDTWDMK